MIRRCRNLLCPVFLLLLFHSLSWGQAQVGSVAGVVEVVRGDFPDRPVFVELQVHEATISSTYTDNQGRFAFHGLGSNLYHVIIKDDAYYPVDERANLDLAISGQAFVQVRLMPREDAKKQSTGATNGSSRFLVNAKEYNRHFPKKALKEFDKGVEADRENKRDDAIRHYAAALAVAPDYYPAHNNLGSDYLSKADFAGAEHEFQEAIRLNQSDGEARMNLANVYLQTRKYDEALKNVEEGLSRDPNSAVGEFVLGSIYERTGKFNDAEHALRQALEIDPKMSRVHLELVNLYLSQHKNAEAGSELKEFLKEFPDDPLAPKAREVLGRIDQNAGR